MPNQDQLDQLYEIVKHDRNRARKWLTVLTVSAVVKYLVVIGMLVYLIVFSGDTRTALCTFRSDLQTRVESSKAFLANHPQGIAGIDASAIRVSIVNQQKTLNSLSSLDC